MVEEKKIRSYPSQSALNTSARLETLRTSAAGRPRPVHFAQLSHQQRTALVEKLIEFLKGL